METTIDRNRKVEKTLDITSPAKGDMWAYVDLQTFQDYRDFIAGEVVEYDKASDTLTIARYERDESEATLRLKCGSSTPNNDSS